MREESCIIISQMIIDRLENYDFIKYPEDKYELTEEDIKESKEEIQLLIVEILTDFQD